LNNNKKLRNICLLSFENKLKSRSLKLILNNNQFGGIRIRIRIKLFTQMLNKKSSIQDHYLLFISSTVEKEKNIRNASFYFKV
jgi:hypothetical protein